MMPNLQRRIKQYSTLYIFMLPAIVVSLVFYYRPMIGLIMAFQKYDIVKGMFASPFVGLENFQAFINDKAFWSALRNTLAIDFFARVIPRFNGAERVRFSRSAPQNCAVF